MSHLQYFAYKGYGEYARDLEHHHQVVRVGDCLHMSGQVGLDRLKSGIIIPENLYEEINQAFDNVDHTLKDAGGKGIEQVYKLVVYLAPLSEESAGVMMEVFKKWFVKHKPVATVIGVNELAYPGQRVEIDADAHLG